MNFRILSLSHHQQKGFFTFGSTRFPCALGLSGATAFKREGDGASPLGAWSMGPIFYRADRVARPQSRLPVAPLQSDMGWCDAVNDRNYNRPVRLPYPASHEKLWRDDHLYDLVMVLDYNFTARSQGRGSAIFLHLAHDDFRGTQGCAALREADLRRVFAVADFSSTLRFG